MKKLAALLLLATAFHLGAAEEKKPAAKSAGDSVVSLFDGKTLKGWKPTDFSTQAGGTVEEKFKDGKPALIIDQGEALSGLSYTNPVPKVNYEVTLEAMRINGNDFFCGLTMPYKDAHFTVVFGGWGGAVTGISSVDASDASENETTKFVRYDSGKWYRIRVRVTDAKIEMWLDDEKLTDLETADKKISMRPGEIESSVPFGIATYQTRAAFRNIQLKHLSGAK